MTEQKRPRLLNRFTRNTALTTAIALGGGACSKEPTAPPPSTWAAKPEAEKISDINRRLNEYEQALIRADFSEQKDAWKAALPNFKIIKEAIAKGDYALASQGLAQNLQGVKKYIDKWGHDEELAYSKYIPGIPEEIQHKEAWRKVIDATKDMLDARFLQGASIAAMLHEMAYEKSQANKGGR